MTPEQEADVEAAVLAYWTSSDEAAARQRARGVQDVGQRAGVTAGGHLDRIAQLLARVCIQAGVPADNVWYKAPEDDPNGRKGAASGHTLPGYFRPTKSWDLVIQGDDGPLVAVELKSQKGPSFGNNANNRAEEAIGNAVDLEHALEAGLVPRRPWTGFVFVIEDAPGSIKATSRSNPSRFEQDPAFVNWSYVERVRILSERLVSGNYYNSAWTIATSRPPKFRWRELDSATTGYVQFIESMVTELRKSFDGSTTPAELSLPKNLY